MIRSRQRLLLTLAVVLVLPLSACGGSDEDDVRSASEDFVAAFKDENWEEVCSLMTNKSKAQLERAGQVLDANGGCEGVWEKASKFIGDKAKRQLDDFGIESVKVDGDTATVTVTNAEAKGQPTQLRKEDGEWRVDFES
jgi:ketosteroid isomerase-like protein